MAALAGCPGTAQRLNCKLPLEQFMHACRRPFLVLLAAAAAAACRPSAPLSLQQRQQRQLGAARHHAAAQCAAAQRGFYTARAWRARKKSCMRRSARSGRHWRVRGCGWLGNKCRAVQQGSGWAKGCGDLALVLRAAYSRCPPPLLHTSRRPCVLPRPTRTEGKPIPTELRREEAELRKQAELEDDNTAVPRTHIDDEYAHAGGRGGGGWPRARQAGAPATGGMCEVVAQRAASEGS